MICQISDTDNLIVVLLKDFLYVFYVKKVKNPEKNPFRLYRMLLLSTEQYGKTWPNSPPHHPPIYPEIEKQFFPGKSSSEIMKNLKIKNKKIAISTYKSLTWVSFYEVGSKG